MNEHLKPIFEVLLPELEKAQFNYWVYGGISIAALGREFIRVNKDIDIFVRDTDFEKIKSVLDTLCNENNFKLKQYPTRNNERPKIEIKINDIERFSMIPVYQTDDMVTFKYKDGDQEYSNQILERIERNTSGYRFFTPPSEFIKAMFINHIRARPDKKKRKEIKKDAKAILSPEELLSLDWVIE